MAGQCIVWLHVSVVALAVSVPAPGAAFAQEGTIAGQVLDGDGDPLPGVTVEATELLSIDQSRLSVTNAQGQYRISGLRPGTHIVTFKLPWFGIVVQDVELSAGLTTVVDAELIAGAIDDFNPLSRLGSFGAFVLNCESRPDGTIGPCRRFFFTDPNHSPSPPLPPLPPPPPPVPR